MGKIPVIAIFDVGKTNKKLFLFDEQYKMVFERSAKFSETVDEDDDPCENLESLRLSVFDSLRDVFKRDEFDIKAINFSTYGASFVYIDESGNPLTPLYNYLKAYPVALKEKFYADYGGEEAFSRITASPVLGSLNSGMQLYRLRYEKPEIFQKIKYALHLPQYMSYLISGNACSDITSIGCHTNLWNFDTHDYHEWVKKEGIFEKLAPIMASDEVVPAAFPGNSYSVGVGLHDSSAALIPYLVNFHDPFLLISTGTWCISLNPFNETPLTADELKQDCLCYMTYKGSPVKASRLFAGYEHEEQTKKIAAHFNVNPNFYKTVNHSPKFIAAVARLKSADSEPAQLNGPSAFGKRSLDQFDNIDLAYHCLISDIVDQQKLSSRLVLNGADVKRIFVDGGFGRNVIYMNLLANAFPQIEVYAASVAQATSTGTALSIHKSWNTQQLPSNMIELKYYAAGNGMDD